MKLNDFPLVVQAFKAIEYDNRGYMARDLNLEAEIPEHWLVPFRAAENTLHRCGDTLVSAVPELKDREEYEFPTKLWEVIAGPVDDDDWKVYRHLGVGEAQGWVTSRLLYEFFDGELTRVFIKENEK